MAEKESIIHKIFVGVAVTVVSTVVLYALNVEKQEAPDGSTRAANEVPYEPSASVTATHPVSDLDIQQKELQLKERELELRSRELEDKYAGMSTADHSSYNLTGTWTGNNALLYNVVQRGDQVKFEEVVNLYGNETVSSAGSGILSGDKIDGTAVGLMGQQFYFTLDVHNPNSLSLSFPNMLGETSIIHLNR